MLVKCACSNCGHSFLTDDQAGDLTCPRCGFVSDAAPAGAAFPAEPAEMAPNILQNNAPIRDHFEPDPIEPMGGGSHAPQHFPQEIAFNAPAHFDPRTPPPVFMTWQRLMRGVLFGGVLTVLLGAGVSGGLAATGLIVPGVAALIMALAAGATMRHGLGGRTATRTKASAMIGLAVVIALGYGSILAGSWLVQRYTGDRSDITRRDLERGRNDLKSQLARAEKLGDATSSTLLETRLRRVERLEAASDAEIEDYLWVQEAQINQPLLAYSKLRLTDGPLLKLGAEREPIEAPKHAALGVAGLELLIAFVLAWRGVKPR
ncbi:MAG: TFIIB-type zinc ribbon-containing protein [Planctomycetota bacterium]|jgi:hypothetical protein